MSTNPTPTFQLDLVRIHKCQHLLAATTDITRDVSRKLFFMIPAMTEPVKVQGCRSQCRLETKKEVNLNVSDITYLQAVTRRVTSSQPKANRWLLTFWSS